MRSLRRVLVAVVVALALPSAAQAADQLNLINSSESIGPGITLMHKKFVNSSGWFDEQVLKVQLSNPAVKSDLLTAPTVSSAEVMSSMTNDAGAAASVNGDFFDIGNTNASTGGEVQNGTLLKSADIGGWGQVGVSESGIGQLADLTLQATATLDGTAMPVLSVNADDSNMGVPANGLIAYTPIWGTGTRARGLGSATDVAEALVTDDKVVSTSTTVGSGAIPANSFYLVGTGTAADAIKALAVGDPVTLAFGLKNPAGLRWAIGTNHPLVSGGQALPETDTSVAPRTAIGFANGGRTMFLLITDGRQLTVPGTTLAQTANMLVDLGADLGVNLDGGGSTELVARALGDTQATVRNTPSDGEERPVPAGIGVFVSPGDGRVHDIILPHDARVFPGLHTTLTAKPVDNDQTPVKASVKWSHASSAGVVHAAADARHDITVTASAGRTHDSTKVRVLQPLHSLQLSTQQLSFAAATPDDAQTVTVTGRDAQGFSAPIEIEDMTLGYDHSMISVAQSSAGTLEITPLQSGSTTLDIKVGGLDEQVAIGIGVVENTVYTFNHADEVSRWSVNGTAAANQTLGLSSDGFLTETYKAERNTGLSANAGDDIPIPGDPLQVDLKFDSSQPMEFAFVNFQDAAGVDTGPLVSPVNQGENDIVFTLPSTVKFPVEITSIQIIQTDVALQEPGTVTFQEIDEDVPAALPTIAQQPLQPDPLVSPDALTSRDGNWHFGTLSDVGLTTDSPTDTQQAAIAALERVRATNPDLIVLNGDIDGAGDAQDMTLARQTLEQAGCDLVPLTSTVGTDDTPAPTASTTPCYYVPGDGEALMPSGTDSLAPFEAEFGQPFGTFDHRGTRFILLASSFGTLDATSFAQLPMLQQALDEAVRDRSVKNVVVVANDPVDDPDPSKSDELGDSNEIALVEKLLTHFREASGKGVAMIGSRARVASVERIEGVPYAVTPGAVEDPRGTPNRGGFTGWDDWHLDEGASAGGQWLTADAHAFAQSITLNAPASVKVGDTASVSGSIVQPEGLSSGTRVVPLAYPMSVHYGGSANLAIGGRGAGKDAVLDPQTGQLTALRRGTVTVTVTSDSMRAFTGPASLAPIVASKTIQIEPR